MYGSGRHYYRIFEPFYDFAAPKIIEFSSFRIVNIKFPSEIGSRVGESSGF